MATKHLAAKTRAWLKMTGQEGAGGVCLELWFFTGKHCILLGRSKGPA